METQTDSDMALLSRSSSSGGAEPALRHTVPEGIESLGWQKPADSPLKSEIRSEFNKGAIYKGVGRVQRNLGGDCRSRGQ